MSVNNIHGIYAVNLHTLGMVSAVNIGGITQQSLPLGSQVRSEASSGSVYPSVQSLVGQKPRASFGTRNLAAALAEIGVLGKAVDADGTHPGLTFYGQQHQEGGTRATGAAHISYNIKEGLIVPTTLSVNHQGDAGLNYDVLVTYDGTNDPIVKAEGVAVPSGITDAERFTLGPITLGGVSIPQVRSLSVDFGLNAVGEGADSDIWDTFANIRTVAPTLTIGGIDIDLLRATKVPLTGLAGAHVNTTVYLRKRQDGGAFVADGVAEHIKLTCAGMAVVESAFSGSGNDAGEVSIRMPLKFDGTNTPIVLDLASTIV